MTVLMASSVHCSDTSAAMRRAGTGRALRHHVASAHYCFLSAAVALIVLATTGQAVAAVQGSIVTGEDPSVSLGTLAAAPTIDGVLAQDEWRGALRLDLRFQIEPGDNVPASEPTDVWLAADRDHLFIAFYARDRDPPALRARVVPRDNLAQEDVVTVYLDTYDDRQRAYRFSFNPLGIQEDGIFSDTAAFDVSWDGIVESKGAITRDGYVVEVAIPFSTLRFRAGPGARWGLHLQRRIARRAETISWVPRSRDISGILQQAGTLTGFDDVSDRHTIDLIPTVVGALDSEREPYGSGNAGSRTTRGQLALGVTAIYAIMPSLTFSGTVNPDFSQVESDVPQISVNQRFALFYPERRPFFFEGTEVFTALSEDLIRLLNTRRVRDPGWGAKLTGKIGRYAVGVLTASDHAPDSDAAVPGADAGRNTQITIARVRRDVGTDSSVGGWLLDRRVGQASNSVLAADARLRVSEAGQLLINLVASRSQDQEGSRTAGHAADVRFNHVARNWRLYLGERYVGPQFRNESGFIERENFHEQTVDVGYEWRPRARSGLSRWLVYVWPYLDVSHSRFADDGTPEVQYADPAVKVQFQRGTSVQCYPSFRREGFAGQVRRYHLGVCEHTVEAFKRVVFSGSVRIGEGLNYAPSNLLVGRQTDVSEELTLRPGDAVSVGWLYLRAILTDPRSGVRLVDQQIVRNRTSWQLTRFHAARAILEYDTAARQFSASLFYAWTPKPNTALHLGWNDLRFNGYDPATTRRAPGWVPQRRTIFMKVSYNLRS